MGFEIDDRKLKRAGLDYWQFLDLRRYPDWATFAAAAGSAARMFFFSTHGEKSYFDEAYRPGDYLVFGRESSGLPPDVLELAAHRVRIPTRNCIRSLNLSTSAGIVLYFALAGVGALEEWT